MKLKRAVAAYLKCCQLVVAFEGMTNDQEEIAHKSNIIKLKLLQDFRNSRQPDNSAIVFINPTLTDIYGTFQLLSLEVSNRGT